MNTVAKAIKSCVKGAEVIFNKCPKVHAMSDCYCQLIPNDNSLNCAHPQRLPNSCPQRRLIL